MKEKLSSKIDKLAKTNSQQSMLLAKSSQTVQMYMTEISEKTKLIEKLQVELVKERSMKTMPSEKQNDREAILVDSYCLETKGWGPIFPPHDEPDQLQFGVLEDQNCEVTAQESPLLSEDSHLLPIVPNLSYTSHLTNTSEPDTTEKNSSNTQTNGSNADPNVFKSGGRGKKSHKSRFLSSTKFLNNQLGTPLQGGIKLPRRTSSADKVVSSKSIWVS